MKTANYYDEILAKIKKLIDNNKANEAMELLKEELKMPFIPQEYEIQFQNLYEKIFVSQVKSFENKNNYSAEKIAELLYSGDSFKEALAVDGLGKINIRLIQNQLKKWIENKNNDKQIAKSFIIEAMIEQKIDIDINLNNSIINPSKSESVLKHLEIRRAFDEIETLVEKEPQLRDVVYSELKRFLLLDYPKIPSDGVIFAKEITNVVKSYVVGGIDLSANEQKIMDKINIKG